MTMDRLNNPTMVAASVSRGRGVSAFSSPPARSMADNKDRQRMTSFLTEDNYHHRHSSSPMSTNFPHHQPFLYPKKHKQNNNNAYNSISKMMDEPEILLHERSHSGDWSGPSAVSATVRKAVEAIHEVITPNVILDASGSLMDNSNEYFDMQELARELKEASSTRGGGGGGEASSSQSTILTMKPSLFLTSDTPNHAGVKKPVAVSPSRAIRIDDGYNSSSSVMRRALRDSAEAVTTTKSNTTNMMATNRTDDEAYMAMKQKRWQEKIKMVNHQTNQQQRRSIMVENSRSLEQRTPPRRKRKVSSGQNHMSFTSVVSSCQSELTEAIDKLVNGKCGDLDDTQSDNNSVESSSFSTDEYYEDTVDDTTITQEQATTTSTVFTPKTAATTTTLSPTTEDDISRSISMDQTDSKSEVTVRTKFGMNDKQFVQEFITSMTKSGLIMILHSINHHNKAKSVDFSKPVKCLTFIQPGMQGVTGKFSGPKLIWKHCTDGRLAGSVDLFQIKSLTKATALDLRDFPLAMPGRSVMVKHHKEILVFEMLSERDAFRFTHGMRWVIARLSFNLIIGNLGVSCELLDVGKISSSDGHHVQFPTTVGLEAKWTRAMNDATCWLVDQSGSQ